MPGTKTVELEEARSAAMGDAQKGAYVREMFTAIAPRYDLLNRVLSFNFDRRWRRKAIAELQMSKDPRGTYLDLCAGTLDVSAMMASQAAFNGRVIGADFSEAMLRAGTAEKAKDHTGRVVAVAADALAMPLAANSCSGAIVAFGIRNVANLDVAIHEVFRVLKSGARFVILEFTTPRNPVFRAGYHAYFHHVLPRVGALVSGHRTAYTYLPVSVAHFPDERTLAKRLEAAGFRDVTWESMMFGVVAIHVATK